MPHVAASSTGLPQTRFLFSSSSKLKLLIDLPRTVARSRIIARHLSLREGQGVGVYLCVCVCAGHTCNRFEVTRALAAAQGCGHKTEIARNYAKFFRNQRIRVGGKIRQR